MTAPTPTFGHVLAMTDDVGTFEHARYTRPRREHGYCTDDMARVLIVAVRQPEPDPAVRALATTAMSFLAAAHAPDGRVRNRRVVGGDWTDRPGVDDCWGRALWAFGTAAARADDVRLREEGRRRFERSAGLSTPHRRAAAFAGLGAAELLTVDPAHGPARRLLAAAVDATGPLGRDPGWPWPEPRLSYANAAVAEVLVAAGSLLGRPGVLRDGLGLLAWLLDCETVAGHLSPTPVGGAGPGDRAPAFDQQPIEVAAMADACWRATAVTGDDRWLRGVDLASAWFAGDNDVGVIMWDSSTGGGYDGLQPDGPNRNQGTESTLAMIATAQVARAASGAPDPGGAGGAVPERLGAGSSPR